jgi:hypothetical protein
LCKITIENFLFSGPLDRLIVEFVLIFALFFESFASLSAGICNATVMKMMCVCACRVDVQVAWIHRQELLLLLLAHHDCGAAAATSLQQDVGGAGRGLRRLAASAIVGGTAVKVRVAGNS